MRHSMRDSSTFGIVKLGVFFHLVCSVNGRFSFILVYTVFDSSVLLLLLGGCLSVHLYSAHRLTSFGLCCFERKAKGCSWWLQVGLCDCVSE
jgi:hypothetical protein